MNGVFLDFTKHFGRHFRSKLPRSLSSSFLNYSTRFRFMKSNEILLSATKENQFNLPREKKMGSNTGYKMFTTSQKDNKSSQVSNKVKVTGSLPKDLELKHYIYLVEKLPPFAKFLGLQVKEAGGGHLLCSLPFKRDFVGNMALPALHGGVIASVIDHVGGFAAWTTLTDSKETLSTIDLRIDYIKPAPCKPLTCKGKVSYKGKTTVFVDMVVYAESSSIEKESEIIALGRGTFSVRKNISGDAPCLNEILRNMARKEMEE